MDCRAIGERLVDWMAGRLDAPERGELERHLAQCPGCSRTAAEMRALWQLLDELPAVEASAAFTARLRQRWEQERLRHDFSLPAWLRPAAAVAATVFLAVWVGFRLPRQPAVATGPGPAGVASEDFVVVKDLAVLEDYDVLVNFEPLSVLPAAPPAAPDRMHPND
jgi:anti-sigma factor RsiW